MAERHQWQPAESETETLLRGDISLVAGNVRAQPVIWQDEPLFLGLKVIIVESGEMLCRFPQQQERPVKGPTLCTVWSQDSGEASQCFLPGKDLRYTAVSLSTHSLHQHLGADCMEQLATGLQLDLAARPKMHLTRIPKCLSGLGAQLVTSPLRGAARQLFMTAKALEIVAYTLESLMTEQQTVPASALCLSSGDIARLHEVKNLLVERIDSPPSITELSVMVGLNTRKLTAGFRRLFNQSIYGYLQTLRLETAWQMLSSGEPSVSAVAYRVGYTPAHFSVAFRKKYGFAPKLMRR